MTRERELRSAIKKSGLSMSAREMYRALLDISDWSTATIPAQWQPRSLRQLAEKAGMSTAHAKRALNELEAYQWVTRHRTETPGRAHRTTYEVALGERRRRPGPVPGAVRIRRYRERKAAQVSVTEEAAEVAQDSVTSGSDTRYKAAPNCVTHPRSDPVFTGGSKGGNGEEAPVNAEEREPGVPVWKLPRPEPDDSWKSWPAGSIGEAMNR